MEESFETCRNPTKPSQKENLLRLKLPLKTPSPIHVVLYFCLRLILVFNFCNFQKKVLSRKKWIPCGLELGPRKYNPVLGFWSPWSPQPWPLGQDPQGWQRMWQDERRSPSKHHDKADSPCPYSLSFFSSQECVCEKQSQGLYLLPLGVLEKAWIWTRKTQV